MIRSAPAPEFSHIVKCDEIGRLSGAIQLEANEAERAALARRFDFASIEVLTADIQLTATGNEILAEGRIKAHLTQNCVATRQPVPEAVNAPITIRFVPENADASTAAGSADLELEIDSEDVDIMEYADERIDLGEAVAQSLALLVNPFPRADDADVVLRNLGVKTEEEAREATGPFAALSRLKNK